MAYNDYGTYLRGLKENIFLKGPNGENYMGQVWPGPVYFPDFLYPKTTKWWTQEVQRFHDDVPFDGMWIDMNEVSNFCSGTCTWNGVIEPDNTTCYLQCKPAQTKYDDPPFKLNHTGTDEPLSYKTAAMTVKHYDGNIEYNTHNLFGISESKATKLALTTVRQKRPFVLSRSTFVGSGQYAAHWTGDNSAVWEDLAASIVTVLNAGLVGIPMVGADICGFNGETNEDLCNRWIQTGAFHPFSRAHNNIANSPKELYLWHTVTISARKALGLKYQLLPYFYTLNYEAHTKGYPIVRPLFVAFPSDANAIAVAYQFLIGNHILVTPVLSPNTTSVVGYFPKGTWYNMFDWSSKIVSKGENFTLDAPWDVINVHVHEGTIIPMQESALTSTEVRKTPFTLVAAFASEALLSTAYGYVFLDNGEEIDMELKANKSSLVSFEAHTENGSGMLKSHVKHGEFALQEGWIVEHLVILGVGADNATSSVVVHLNKHLYSTSNVSREGSTLHFSGLALPLGTAFELTWSLE
jgi:alpha-D-xyloside xylohydrolase